MKRLISLLLLILISAFAFTSCDLDAEKDKNESGTETGDNNGGENEENPGGEEEELPPIGKEIGNLAGSFALELVCSDGKASIEDYRGKVVVVNFWGTWCGPCKSELPHFNTLADEYSEEVVFFLVHSTYGAVNAESYIAENLSDSRMVFVYDLPLSSDGPDMYFNLLGGTEYYPHTVVLDERGVITYMQDGMMSYSQLKEKIDNALSE